MLHISVEENPNFHCIVCNAEFLSRAERNEHLETHFVHSNCESCNRQVIIIGDLEFELHRPTHCKPNELIDDDETTELLGIYETNDDNHLFDEQENCTERLIQPESDGNDVVEADETDNGPVMKISNSDPDSSPKLTTVKRTRNRTYTDVKNESKPTKRLKRADASRPAHNSNSEDDVFKQMDVALLKRRRKYRKLPKTVPCMTCDAMFGTERTLKIHMHQVHGIKERYICPICSREFKIGGNLKQHIETHSDYKRYVCNYCGKGFHLPYNLKEHMNTHTGAR